MSSGLWVPFHAAARSERLAPEVVIARGDALELLARLPAGAADCLLADPPYRLSGEGTTVQSGQRVSVDKGAWDRWPSIDAYASWSSHWLRLAQRALKRSGTIWISATHHALFAIGLQLQRLDFHILNLITWYKPNASPNVGCRQLTHSAEHVIWAAPRLTKPLAHTFNYDDLRVANGGKQLRDVWELAAGAPKDEKEEGKHPTQKPLALVARMLEASTRPGDLVVDPFLGSGTTAVAAMRLGRAVIGFEQDRTFLQLARRRITAAGKAA